MKARATVAAISAAAVIGAAGTSWAMPSVSGVSMTQRDNSRTVDIGYTLAGEAAIVTLSIETNGVALPDSAVTTLSGDVCMVVEPGTRSIVWNAGADWPENVTENAKARVTAWQTNAPPQIMVIDLSKGTAATAQNPYPVHYYTSLDALPGGGVSNAIYKTDGLVLRKISSGNYAMGDEATAGASVMVTLTHDFYAGIYEVTQKQWYKVMGTDPSDIKNPMGPVEKVSYYQIQENPNNTAMTPNWPQSDVPGGTSFMGLLRTRTGLAGFALPTEAQWEYACRAGTTTYYNDGISGASTNQLNNLGWWSGNSGATLHTVGQLTTNAWGLYDMHGNTWEWCLDWREDPPEGGTDPDGADAAVVAGQRVRRGAWYGDSAAACRSAYRSGKTPNTMDAGLGFRLFRTLP